MKIDGIQNGIDIMANTVKETEHRDQEWQYQQINKCIK